MPQPSGSELKRLKREAKADIRDKLVTAFPEDKTLIMYLFQESIEQGNATYILTTNKINTECFDNKKLAATLRGELNRLNAKFARYYDSHGKTEPIRVDIVDETRELRFTSNRHVQYAGDVAERFGERFWSPYIDPIKPVQLVYPELQFFRDNRETYFRNPQVNSIEQAKEIFQYLNIGDGTALMPSVNFVSSGVVVALMLLSQCFHKYETSVYAKNIRPSDRPLDSDDHNPLIVLATPTAHGAGGMSIEPLVVELERGLPIQHSEHKRNVTIVFEDGRGQEFPDDLQGVDEATSVIREVRKWVVLTRRHEGSRLVTLLAGWHGRTIEGLAQILVGHQPQSKDWTNLAELATELKCGGNFPPEFQALFEVHLTKRRGEPRLTGVRLHKALSI